METSLDFPRWIRRFRSMAYSLFLVRFNLIVLIAGWAILLVDQGQDALVGYVAEENWLRSGFWFFLWVFYWAFSIWFFARTLFRFRYPTTPARTSAEIPDSRKSVEIPVDDPVFRWMTAYLPRLLGALAFVVVAHALWRASGVVEPTLTRRLFGWSLFSLLLMIPFFVIVQYRRGVCARLSNRLGGSATWFGSWLEKFLRTIPLEREKPYENLFDLFNFRAHPWGVFVILASVIGFVAFVASILDPVGVGTSMGAVLMFFLWAGSWLPLGSFITYIGNRYGVPMISLLLVASIVFSMFNDNHEIRSAGPLTPRKTSEEALALWRQQQSEKNNHRLLLVAAAGGGIRAAYWTATVLGALHQSVPEFDDKLFAISGVSGGSVGAAVYRAVLAEGGDDIAAKTRSVLSRDFLGPAVAALLYPDLAQRFLPYAGLPDRGAAMEKGWESAYRKVLHSPRFGESLSMLYQNAKPWPALMMNATRVETGRRSIASNLKLEFASRPDAFAVIDDQLEALGHDLALSTAAFNSARFPGISPAGYWRKNGRLAGRLVDGAYFENFGAEALLGLLHAIDWRSPEWKDFRPVIIAITSDPEMTTDFFRPPEDVQVISIFHEIVAPVQAALKTSSSHSIEALLRLKQETESLGGEFLHFRMCPRRGKATHGYNPPLGWSLSEVSRKTIESYLTARCNAATVARIRGL